MEIAEREFWSQLKKNEERKTNKLGDKIAGFMATKCVAILSLVPHEVGQNYQFLIKICFHLRKIRWRCLSGNWPIPTSVILTRYGLIVERFFNIMWWMFKYVSFKIISLKLKKRRVKFSLSQQDYTEDSCGIGLPNPSQWRKIKHNRKPANF